MKGGNTGNNQAESSTALIIEDVITLTKRGCLKQPLVGWEENAKARGLSLANGPARLEDCCLGILTSCVNWNG